MSCEFYADEADLAELLRASSRIGRLKFLQIYSRPDQPNDVFVEDAVSILPGAVVSPQAPDRRHSFLVMYADQEVFSRRIELKDGSGKISIVDQNQNWIAVTIAFGGDAGDQTLIMSDINTTADTDQAVELHKKFKKLVKSMTARVGPKGRPCLLMPGAAAKAGAGWRLARGKGWSRSTDPAISAADLAKLKPVLSRGTLP